MIAAVESRMAWRKRVEGRFLGSFLDIVEDHVVYKLRRERIPGIVCLNAKGRTAWDREFEFNEIGIFFPYGRDLYVEGTKARRLSVESGETVTERDFGERVQVRPPIASGPVYILGDLGQDKALTGLHPETLETVWQWDDPDFMVHDTFLCRDIEGWIETVDLTTFAPRRVRCGERIGGVHGHHAGLWCQISERERLGISLDTGEVVWRHREAEDGFHGMGVGDVVFEGDRGYSGGRAVTAYDLSNGAILWRTSMPAPVGRLRLGEGRILAGSKGGMVYALDTATGAVLVSHDLKAESLAIAPLGANRIVVGTYKVIYCLETS